MILSAPINTATSGDHNIVAGVQDRKIRVLGYVLVAAGAVNVKFRSATSKDLSGPYPMAAQTVVSSGLAPVMAVGGAVYGHFETNAGEALNLNLDANVQVSGHVTYSLGT